MRAARLAPQMFDDVSAEFGLPFPHLPFETFVNTALNRSRIAWVLHSWANGAKCFSRGQCTVDSSGRTS